MAPLVAIELSKQHSHFPNESIVVGKIYLKKSLKPCSSPLVKIIILLLICTAEYVGIKHSLKSINDVCRVFQRPFACMNDPEIKQIYT